MTFWIRRANLSHLCLYASQRNCGTRRRSYEHAWFYISRRMSDGKPSLCVVSSAWHRDGPQTAANRRMLLTSKRFRRRVRGDSIWSLSFAVLRSTLAASRSAISLVVRRVLRMSAMLTVLERALLMSTGGFCGTGGGSNRGILVRFASMVGEEGPVRVTSVRQHGHRLARVTVSSPLQLREKMAPACYGLKWGIGGRERRRRLSHGF
jgi:hypothetical protein